MWELAYIYLPKRRAYRRCRRKIKARRSRKARKREKLMVSGSKKGAVLHEDLQTLRSITRSHALNRISIIKDASRYIGELKEKIQILNQDIATGQTSSDDQNALPLVTVETLENGFLVNVFSEKSCPGLLVCILEAFEEVGLTVLEARVSCTERFRFQAFGGENDEQGEAIEAEALKVVVVEAIKSWSEGGEQD